MHELNDAQKQAVSHFEGPMLVLAGPGSGKTRVITERIHHLIFENGVKPHEILVITFTKAAAMEMKERFQKLYSDAPKGVRFGTFHAIFFMILKNAYGYSADNIVREDIKRDILKRIISETDVEIQDENEFLNDCESEISKVKGDRIDLQYYYSPLCSSEAFREIFEKYQGEMARRRLIDFDDMLVYCYELLANRQDILEMWQRQFPYILIDEFQDICLVQYDIVKLLAAPKNNVFVVGDDDQSIYGFRGAKPDIMKYFLNDFSEAKKCLLGVNYRCMSPIVEGAMKVISHNKNRMPKEITPAILLPDTMNKEDSICIREYDNIKQQNEEIVKKIIDFQKNGIPLTEMAVLFRTNTQARPISLKLMEYNIPFQMKEVIPNLYDHWIVKDIITYIKVARGNRERAKVMQIINRPTRYIHRNAFTEKYVDFEELKKFYEDKDWMVERIEDLQYNLMMLAQMKPYAAINFIRRGIGYDDYLNEYAQAKNISVQDLYEILDELMDDAKDKNSYDAWFQYMEEYRQELNEQNALSRRTEEKKGVTLLTMHGAKGLEYTSVFIPDANEGVTPHSKSVLTCDMEEERRMFYVAMTRAKKHLHISYVKERFNKEVDMSRFVQEIMEEKN